MSEKSFELGEFIQPPREPVVEVEELDVQKVVVEELAAEKAALGENISTLEKKIENLMRSLDDANGIIEAKDAELAAAKDAIEKKQETIASLEKALSEAKATIATLESKLDEKLLRELDTQERNPNALALLDRDTELPDRFPGETRDHVLEVVKDARDAAEKEGRRRRAQLLESVLVANEPNGELAKKRAALEKFFKDNGNIITGAVIKELERCGISYKDGEEYLLPKEILLRTY